MKTFFCLVLLLFSFRSISQTQTEVSYWEAKTEYNDPGYSQRLYQLTISKDSVFVTINNQYKYGYKLHGKKEKQYFKIGDDRFIINQEKDKLNIAYYDDKLRVAVNEIVMVDFKKCNSK